MSEATVYAKVWRANVLFEYLESSNVESLAEFARDEASVAKAVLVDGEDRVVAAS